MTSLRTLLTGEILHAARPYDPQERRERYLRERKLKGRRAGSPPERKTNTNSSKPPPTNTTTDGGPSPPD
jgi:hypothetical protein